MREPLLMDVKPSTLFAFFQLLVIGVCVGVLAAWAMTWWALSTWLVMTGSLAIGTLAAVVLRDLALGTTSYRLWTRGGVWKMAYPLSVIDTSSTAVVDATPRYSVLYDGDIDVILQGSSMSWLYFKPHDERRPSVLLVVEARHFEGTTWHRFCSAAYQKRYQALGMSHD